MTPDHDPNPKPPAGMPSAGSGPLAWLRRWRGRWNHSLRIRLLSLGLMPLLLLFPLALAVLYVAGGERLDAIANASLRSDVAGSVNYLQVLRRDARVRVGQLARVAGLQALLQRGVDAQTLNRALYAAAEGAGFDYLLVVRPDGTLVGSSTGVDAGRRLPDSYVLRQAGIGVDTAAFERVDAATLDVLSPRFPERARVPVAGGAAGESRFETRGLIISAGAHFPLSADGVDAVLLGGILINGNVALIDHMREFIYPIGGLPDDAEGVTSVHVDGVTVAMSRLRQLGDPPLGSLAPPEALKAVLERGEPWTGRQSFGGVSYRVGYQALLDGEERRVGLVAAGFPDAPLRRVFWLIFGFVGALLALTLLLISLAYLRAGRELTGGLARIGAAMSAVRGGDRSARVGQPLRRDELGQLMLDFDSLLDTIAAQDAAQRAAQQSLADEASRRRALFEHERDGVVILNPDGSIFEANPSFRRMLGHPPEALAGLRITDWMIDFDAPALQRLLGGIDAEGRIFETRHRRRDGSVFDAEVSLSRAEWGGRVFIFALQRDISGRKRTEAELRRHREHLEAMVDERTHALQIAKEAAEAASRAKSTFLANMSHELRTPLNGILGMTELARRLAAEPRQQRYLELVAGSSKHLLAVINDILDISRIEADRLVLQSTVFRLGGLLEEVRNMIESQARDKGLRFSVAIAPELEAFDLRGDALRLRQILLNLLGNAVRFTERGEVALRVDPAGQDERRERLRFEVRDTGVGVAEADQRRLFLPFEQVDGTLTRQHGGTGLGLAISRRLAEAMGGEIGVDSTPGFGSCFWFTAWLERVEGAGATTADDARGSEAALRDRHAGLRVLLVEDEPVNREVAQALLEQAGLAVELAGDGEQAVEMARRHPYALVLMDMQMPRMGGIDATRAIRQLPGWQDTPIIAMTANAFEEDRRRCLEAGMNDHVGKPVDPERLYAVVDGWLSRRGNGTGT